MNETLYTLTTSEVISWLLIVAIVFTAYGMWVGFKKGALDAAEATIDVLIENGFIKSRTNENGEVELLKYNEE